MQKMWYSFLPCLLFLQLEANPGLKVRITQKGLDYGRKIGIELLKQRVLKETFPNWSGQESFSIVKVNYTISRFRVDAVDIPETSASFIPGTGVSLSVAHASAIISADWRVKTWLLKDQGGFTLSISELFIAIVFKVSRDSTGHLSVLLHSCQLSIGSVKVKLNEGSSWIYSFLSVYLEKAIHSKLEETICLNIKYKIQIMDAHLRKQKVLSQIDAFAQIDYSLVSSPAVFKSHINLDLKGTVYPVGNHTDPPFVPAPFGLPNKGDSMLYLGVSNYFLKSATLAYYRAGVFNITISKDITVAPLGIILGQGNTKFKHGLSRIKLATTFNLTTAVLEDFVPEIALHCLTACPVLLKLMATSPPVVILQSDTCRLWITGSVEVFAVLPNSTIQYIFTGNLCVPRHLFIRLKVIQLSQPCTDCDLNDSNDKEGIRAVLSLHSDNKYQRQFDSNQTEADHLITSEEVSLVENFLSYTLRRVVIPVINDKLGKGFSLPNLAHTSLVGPVIKMNQGHLVICTDVHYKHEQGEDEDLRRHP